MPLLHALLRRIGVIGSFRRIRIDGILRGLDPPPKKYFSISATRNLRALGSNATSRYSLISIVWWPSHFCQASFETFSKMRWPSHRIRRPVEASARGRA
jgi:hypothetical protein